MFKADTIYKIAVIIIAYLSYMEAKKKNETFKETI